MAVSSLRFRIDGDNTGAMSSIAGVRTAASQLGHDIQHHIGDSLKSAFTVTVIEEVVRRTGEWAEALQKSANQLGVNTAELQALQLAARRAGMDQDKIITLYNRIEAAANKATKSQKAFSESFGKLGFQQSDLSGEHRLNTAQLTQRVINSHGEESAYASIVGSKNLLQFNALQREFKGRSLEEYQKENQSQIVPAGQVSEIAKAWEQIMEDLKSLGNKLTPLIAAVILIVDGLLKMVNGVIGTLGSFIKPGNWMSGENTLRSKTIGRGLANFIPQTASGLVNLGAFVIGDPYRANWHFMKGGKEAYEGKLSEEAIRESEGAAEGIGTYASFGAGPLSKLAIGRKATGTIGGLEFGGTRTTLGGGIVPKIAGNIFKKRSLSSWVSLNDENLIMMIGDALEGGQTLESLQPILAAQLGARRTKKLLERVAKGIGPAGAFATAGGVGTQDIGNPQVPNSFPAPDRGSGLNLGGGGNFGGAAGGNLAIGGVYGVDIQSRILSLNEKSVALLEQIVQNTTPSYAKGDSSEESSGY